MNPAVSSSDPPAPGRPSSFSVAKAWLRALEAISELGDHSLETLPAVIEERAAQRGAALAVISGEARLSYGQLSGLSNRYARWALANGVRVGDVVGLMMGNSADYLALWLGVTHVGGVVALLNTNLVGASLAHCIAAAAPNHLVAEAALLSAVRGAQDFLPRRVPVWVAGAKAPGQETGQAPGNGDHIDTASFSDARLRKSERRPVTLSHKALLIYTSGATGLPKAANVSHYRIISWSRWFSGLMDVQPDDRMYDCLPLYQGVGGIVAPGAVLVAGGALVLGEKFSATRFWSDIVETRCTLFPYTGDLCRSLVNAPFSADEQKHGIRMACGTGLRRDVWERFQQRFHIPRILEFYAATAGNFSLFNVEGAQGAIGRAPSFLAHRFPLALIKVDVESGEPARDAQGFCVRAVENEIGEAIGGIALDGGGIVGRFEGYTSAIDTEKKILRHVFMPGDVWYRTGDLMRADSRRFLYFVDRIGDAFRWKGETVAPSDVEDALTACPGVRAAVVYGVRVPGYDGRAGMAAIVIDKAFDLSGLHRHVETSLPACARPVFLRLCREIEMAGTFRQNRRRFIDDSYDPDLIGACVCFDEGERYVRLDEPLMARIESGQLRL
jgi:fatty-acyl-CoA synthase